MTSRALLACLGMVLLFTAMTPTLAWGTNDPQVTANGSLVAAESSIVATGTGMMFTSTSGSNLFGCSAAKLTGKLLKNSGGTVEAEISTANFFGTGSVSPHSGLNECTGSFGNAYYTFKSLPLRLRSDPTMATDEFQIAGAGGTKVKILLGSTTSGECEWESTSSIKGDYTTAGAAATLTIRNTAGGSGLQLVKGGFLCPSSLMLRASFDLETEGGAGLTIS